MNSFHRKALFLDRDGVINVDHGYVWKIEDFEFCDGIFELLRLFSRLEFQLFIITNQSGIGRGYYTHENYKALTQWMLEKFQEQNIIIEEVFYCPHTPQAGCRCRKPDIGMIEQAKSRHLLDLERSWMIGDKASDIDMAHNASIKNTIYIGDQNQTDATFSFASVRQCAEYLQANTGKIV